MKNCDLKCKNSTCLNKLGVMCLDKKLRYFSTLLCESIWNGIYITAPALHMVVKRVFKFLLEWHVLIELHWHFEFNLLKGLSVSKLAKIWPYSMPFFTVLLV